MANIFFSKDKDNCNSIDIIKLGDMLKEKYNVFLHNGDENNDTSLIDIPILVMSKVDLLNLLCINA